MEEPWLALGSDPAHLDERVTAYYINQVWLLNGLFIQQYPQSHCSMAGLYQLGSR